MQIPTDLEHAVVKQKRGERLIRRIGMTMRYVKIVLQSGKCRTAKRSIAHCRSKKWSSGWGPQGCSKSPSNFPIVRERVLRDARKLKKRLVGAPGLEPGGLLRPRQHVAGCAHLCPSV